MAASVAQGYSLGHRKSLFLRKSLVSVSYFVIYIYIYIYVRDPGMVAILVKALFCSGMVGGPSRAWPKRIASKKRGVSPHNVARVIYVPSVSIHLRVLIASLHLSRVFSFSL